MSDEGQAVDLSREERADINGMFIRLANVNHYELLGVQPDADRRTIRDAYFALSQRFHPDAWFGKSIGEWKPRMEAIFREVTKAYDVLSNRHQRAAYDASIGIAPRTAVPGGGSASRPVPVPTAESPVSSDRLARPEATTRHPAVGVRPGSAAPEAVSPAPWWETTDRTESLVIPDRSAPPRETHAPQPKFMNAAPRIDPEVARRAGRETLARKLRGHGASAMQTGRFPTSSGPSVPQPPPGATTSSSTMASLLNVRTQRLDSERVSRVEHYLHLAEASAQGNDLLGASNALQLALSICPDDPALTARAQEAAFKVAASMADKYIEQARREESEGRLEKAAESWQRAATGRPKDYTLLLHAATALLHAGRELSKAAELARRVTQVVQRVDAWALLAEIYLAAGMKASASAAVETAAKLDPTSPVVKDLQVRIKS